MLDGFTSYVMHRLPREVRATLTEEQLGAIRRAVYESRPGQGHAIDARITLPLFFCKLYFVFQCGRDRRSQTRQAEDQRRKKVNRTFDLILFGVLLFYVLQIVFVALYLIKSWLGINLFSDAHLMDFVPDF